MMDFLKQRSSSFLLPLKVGGKTRRNHNPYRIYMDTQAEAFGYIGMEYNVATPFWVRFEHLHKLKPAATLLGKCREPNQEQHHRS